MTKDKIVLYLNYYLDIKKAIALNHKEIIISKYRQKFMIVMNHELILFMNAVDKIKKEIDDAEVLNIFILCFEKKLSNNLILTKIHMSPSTFYRIKNKLIEKLLLLCAVYGIMSEEDIAEMKIS